jgi:hypothetical protein
MTGLALVFQGLDHRPVSVAGQLADVLTIAVAVPFAWVGALICARRPGNRIGVLLLSVALLLAGAGFAQEYVRYGVDHHRSLPGFWLANWLGNWTGPAEWAALVLLLLLFPDGQPASPRWRRWVLWPVAVWSMVSVFLAAFAPELEVEGARALDNPIGLPIPADWGRLWWSWFVVAPACLVAATASLIVRYRRGNQVERQQLKWLAYATGLVVAAWLLYPLDWLGDWKDVISALAGWGIPAAIGIAVLRYHLYDIDQLIRRTLSYGLLTVLLGLGYVVLVVGLGQLLGRHRSSLVVAAATLAMAALVRPARRSTQRLVDRRFNRSHYQAAKVVEGFSVRARQETDLDALTAELLRVATLTLQPTHVSLWLRPPAASDRALSSAADLP